MRILVSATGDSLESAVDPRFGRARQFLVVDTETGACNAVDNAQNLNAAQGAGIQAAENASRENVEAIVTGHCGPKAFRALQAAKVRIFLGATGTVAEAVEAFKNGDLEEASGADVEGHWV